jgi:hypothetical protein
LSAAKKHHLKSRHPQFDIKLVQCERKITPVIPSAALPKAERDWTCPICAKGLPKLPYTHYKASVRKHCQEAHPAETLTSLYRRTMKGREKPAGFGKNMATKYAKLRKQLRGDHKTFALRKPVWDTTTRGQFVYCSGCLSQLQHRKKDFYKMSCAQRLAALHKDPNARQMRARWWRRVLKEDPPYATLFAKAAGWSVCAISKLLKVTETS